MRLGLLPAGAPPDGAFRLVHGEGDGLSGFLIDAYGEFLIQYVLARGLREWGRRLAEAICRGAEARGLKTAAGQPWPRGVLQKVRDKGAAKPGKPVQSTVCGEEPPPKYQVHENGVPFEIHPLAGLNVGLFTDMREHRWRIGRFARGARVLNTFAYTGSLSVAAAMQGAAHVTSVDLSSGVLKWAEENFRLAGLDPARHRFEASDTLRFLEAAARAGERFDLVILDPPTFSAARAASWSMRQDLEALIASAVSLLPRGGILWFSGNSHQLSEQDIDLQIEHGARAAGRELALLETGGLPPDYPTPPALPKARYLKLRILRAP
jgi:23S rRNA (cytosine1962-C5)-methyltransferase